MLGWFEACIFEKFSPEKYYEPLDHTDALFNVFDTYRNTDTDRFIFNRYGFEGQINNDNYIDTETLESFLLIIWDGYNFEVLFEDTGNLSNSLCLIWDQYLTKIFSFQQ